MKVLWANANLRLKIGLIAMVFFLVLGFLVPLIPHVNPIIYNTFPKNLKVGMGGTLLGTTALGQDIFWLMVESLRNSILIGLIVGVIGTTVGVFIGLLSGFLGGFADRALMVLTDTFVVIPSLPILILMTSLMKGQAGIPVLALTLGLFAWAWPSRQVRAMALSLKERDFIQTAWFSGEGAVQTVFTEILPFVWTWALSNFMNAVLTAIASESSLAVLGLSPANLPTLGNMIQWSRERNAILLRQWNWIGPPVLLTIVLFIALFLLITGYNDYQTKKRGR
ncbi:MAG TPA: ABC transporter permease [Clostridia bacterium]|nr:ABC transporter permease [Clostridia bacterium]